jgi:serine/threonine protein kinase
VTLDRRSARDPLVGKTIGGRYRLLSRVGTGGMSSVYLARHVLIDRLMAIKTLRRDLAEDPIQRDRFVREARAVNRINHPNIVEITDFGETDDGLVYLVMEYVAGDSLLSAMRDAPFPPLRAFDIAEQCGQALARAHQMGVIHRDLKPDNILIVQQRERADFVKILDFGIAKIMDAPSLTGSQQIFGTPGYIAPEYIQSTAIDGRADLYSLGVILYEMVTGALPFDYEYPGDLLVKHVTEPPVRPRVRRPDLLQPVEDFVLRCLEKDPDKRFRDAFHFLDELRLCRERIGGDLTWGGLNETDGDLAKTNQDLRSSSRDAPTEPPPPGERPFGAYGHEGVDLPLDGLKAAPLPSGFSGDFSGLDHVSAGVSAELSAEGASQPITADYDRRQIPVAPVDDLLDLPIEVVEPVVQATAARAAHPSSRPVLNPASGNTSGHTSGEHGLAGVRKWRQRFTAIREALDEIEETSATPPDIEHQMAEAERALEALEEGVKSAQMHQSAVESLAARARDARATLGRTLDELAGELSKRRGELLHLVERRADLTERREASRARHRLPGMTEGDADALLWELAAVEEELRKRGGACDELEGQIAELRLRLERENEEVEIELSVQVHLLDGEMTRVIQLATELRGPLETAEAYVRASWDESGSTSDREPNR